MVSKLKIISLTLIALLALSGCKKNNWYDWKTLNEVWLKQNLINNPDIQVSSSGLQYRILADPNPSEQRPHSACTVVCDYKTALINGAVVDQAEEAVFAVSGVVPGFQEGLRKIHVHGDIELWVPADLAYGKDGAGIEGNQYFVPPYSVLYFKIHLHASSAD